MNKHKPKALRGLTLVLSIAVLLPQVVLADWTQAKCERYTTGENKPVAAMPCVFSQRQGFISISSTTINGEDMAIELEPDPSQPGKYRDQSGQVVHRHIEGDNNILVFENKNETWKVIWTAVSARRAPGTSGAFDETLVLQGISFHVRSPNNSSLSPVTIAVAGLERGPSTLEREADGVVTGAEAADLDGDGSPEIYVYTTSAGSGSYGGLIAFSSNNRKSLSDIYLPPLDENKEYSRGYMGHDEFAVVEQALVRRFPLYGDNDTNAAPTGGTRQLQYHLVPGEASWLLQVDKVVDY